MASIGLETTMAPRRALRDGLILWGLVAVAAMVAGIFLWLLSDIIWHGLPRISWSFLTTEPRSSGRLGGILPIIVSTILLLAITIAVALPLGLATAILLVEFARTGSRAARLVSLSLDVLAGIPSIVFGLFGNAFFCVWLGLGFSILSGGLTLACMALPILIRTTEAGLRAVPADWRLGAAALGLTRAAALTHILLPAAAPAVVAGLMLGIGRAAAETAALVFTSGYVDRMPDSVLDSGRAIAVHIYDLSMNVSGGEASAYASALVLVGMLIIVNSGALLLSNRLLRKRIVLS
ncbi:MAG: phosphate ABC transporter permease PstA [Hyphomicrobiaceae bacterium]|nr:phosphate ABC transporter permease PstA [Hyphomicrobiaceae bacterium]